MNFIKNCKDKFNLIWSVGDQVPQQKMYCKDLHEYMGVTKTCSLPRFEAVFSWGSGTLEEMWGTRFHSVVRNWEGAWLPEKKSQARGGFRVPCWNMSRQEAGQVGLALLLQEKTVMVQAEFPGAIVWLQQSLPPENTKVLSGKFSSVP